MKLRVSAPSNIALIKYMGKTDTQANRPANRSLSWTLGALRTTVEIEADANLTMDVWEPLDGMGPRLELSEKGKQKFLKHVERVRQVTGVKGFFHIRSANNFPSDCGIASSASSFAALTMAVIQISEKLDAKYRAPSLSEQAALSRQGSGSSCRSFFAPWSLWDQEGARGLELPVAKLIHQVVVLNAAKKEVSSSEAHQRCTTSLLFQGRVVRAEQRLESLIKAFREGSWRMAMEITWAEFWDMHALFETSQPAFGYFHPDSFRVLAKVRDFWQAHEDGPLATMDAGANVHLLWRVDQKVAAEQFGNQLAEFARVLMTDEQENLREMPVKERGL